jgi:hypothetical protein
MSHAEDGQRPAGTRPRLRSRGRRVPAWVVVPLAALAGYAGAGWVGLALGGVAGIFLWRSRR